MKEEEEERFLNFMLKIFVLLYHLKQPGSVDPIINQHHKIFLMIAQESIENTFSMT